MSNREGKCVVVTGGGTGGHVYPALPVLRLLQEQGYRLLWIGSRGGVEEGIVRGWDVPYKAVSTGKLRRYFSLRNFTDVFRIFAGFCQSLLILMRHRPVLLFSKGGFVSVPPAAAAAVLKIPVLTHDSDVDPGLATKINGRFARKIFVPYEESLSHYPPALRAKAVVSGNPVRGEFSDPNQRLPEEWAARIGDKKLLVVIGGSLGAQQLNRLVAASREQLTSRWFVVHQLGGKNALPPEGENYLPLAYIAEELPALFRRADLVLSRAGAGILWELVCAGTPGLLLPLVEGSRGDQPKNAEIFRRAGIAEVLQEDPSAADLIKALEELCAGDRLAEMARAARNFAGTPAEERIFRVIREEERG